MEETEGNVEIESESPKTLASDLHSVMAGAIGAFAVPIVKSPWDHQRGKCQDHRRS